MAQDSLVSFHEDFEAPKVRARLDTLLLLAEALRPYLKDLYRTLPSKWNELLDSFAETLIDELRDVDAGSEAEHIWKQFLTKGSIRKLGENPQVILESVSARLNVLAGNEHQSQEYLARANREAVDWIRGVGNQRGISSFVRVAEIPLRLYYDPEARGYCASSNQTSGEIGWKLQLRKHAVYGALIPDMLFEHEYISHVLPLNRYLSDGVREVWLDCALSSEHRNSSVDRGQKHVNLFLWDQFRRELAKHFDSDIELYGPPRLDIFAYSLYRHAPGIFWLLTSEIVHMEDERALADSLDDLLAQLTDLDDRNLDEVLAEGWQGLDGLYAAVRNLSY